MEQINKILLEKIDKLQKIIEDQTEIIRNLSKREKDERDARDEKNDEKEMTQKDFCEYFNKHMQFIANESFPKKSGYYCKMSYDMFLKLVNFLHRYGIEPKYGAKMLLGGIVIYSEGLMFTNLQSLEATDNFLKKRFNFVYYHYRNEIDAKTLEIENLTAIQLARAIKSFNKYDEFEQKIVEAFMEKIKRFPKLYKEYFSGEEFIGDEAVKNALRFFGHNV